MRLSYPELKPEDAFVRAIGREALEGGQDVFIY